jgi:pyruvate kinase
MGTCIESSMSVRCSRCVSFCRLFVSPQAVSATLRDTLMCGQVSVMEAIASSSVRTTFDLRAAVIIVLTETGTTARYVAKYRPLAPIITVTSSEHTARQSLVSRGLFPLLVGSMAGSDSLINRVLLAVSRLGMCKPGDLAVVTSGSREATAGATNEMKVVEIK